MKKKKLQSCSRCGARNLVNPKAHRCKSKALVPVKQVDVELVKPAKLDAIEAELTPVIQRVTRKTEDLLYDMVHAGLFLMKAQDAYRVCNVSHAADGKFDGSAGDTGFSGWLADKYPGISRRTAYNWINAAGNCGLTIKDGATSIAELRDAKALHGKTAGELYRLTDSDGGGDDGAEPTKWSLVRDTAVSMRDACDGVLAMRDQMNKKAFETVCARLHRTLEQITGSDWDMVNKRKAEHFKEHGDIYEIGS